MGTDLRLGCDPGADLAGGSSSIAGVTLPAMGIAQRLRSLDDRVFGRPKPPTAKTYRATFLVGLFGTLTVLVVSAITGEWSFIAGVGGFLGIMLASVLRWYDSTRSHRNGSLSQR